MILVFGQSGQVGHELQSFADTVSLSRNEADLRNQEQCVDLIREHNPSAVINAAAYTNVDRAEEDEELATIINSDAPRRMAETCAILGIPFVHLSTDYVFDGSGNDAWLPVSKTNPKNVYGQSKEAGERGVIESGVIYGILRTSWVVSSRGDNFIKTMLRLSETCNELSIVSDQIGAPTPARDIAHACYQIATGLVANPEKSEVYHFSGTPNVSWYDFAAEIFRQVGRNVHLTPILSADYPTAASRPLNSRLDCEGTLIEFGIEQPDWREGLKEILVEMGVLS
ncbi:dTDP-4-dehydrorhamnose reductase [Alphaproteobacteria bacterium]|nr:dTDP-4-dehydrorhamnose reductase [Alphaproteobacteria bacterium]